MRIEGERAGFAAAAARIGQIPMFATTGGPSAESNTSTASQGTIQPLTGRSPSAFTMYAPREAKRWPGPRVSSG